MRLWTAGWRLHPQKDASLSLRGAGGARSGQPPPTRSTRRRRRPRPRRCRRPPALCGLALPWAGGLLDRSEATDVGRRPDSDTYLRPTAHGRSPALAAVQRDRRTGTRPAQPDGRTGGVHVNAAVYFIH